MALDHDRVVPDSARSPRAEPDNRIHPHLPVTAEVGSEGGSYSDPTHQVATFENDVPRTNGLGGSDSGGTNAGHRDEIVGGGSDPNHGMIRYPTEPPDSPTATGGKPAVGPNWRAGIIGGIAGAAAVAALHLLRRRVRDQRPATDPASEASALD